MVSILQFQSLPLVSGQFTHGQLGDERNLPLAALPCPDCPLGETKQPGQLRLGQVKSGPVLLYILRRQG